MRDKNFLGELLLKQQQEGPQAVQSVSPSADILQPTPTENQVIGALESPGPTVGGFTPLAELEGRELLAKSLLQQADDRNAHPLARGIAAFFGAKNLQQIAAEKGRTESALRKIENERKALEREEDLALKREGLDIQRQGVQLQTEQAKEKTRQFEETLKLKREEFNANRIKDAQDRVVTKIPSQDGQVELLFKGNEPVNDGLDKGQQWAIDKEGNRVAVPIPVQPTERAINTKDLTLAVVDRLIANEEGVRENFGPFDQITPALQDNTREALTDLNQLRSLLTVENLDLMSGVLSETDIKILQNVAGGGLAESNTEEGALRALREIKQSLQSTGAKKDSGVLKFNRATGEFE